MLVVGGVISVFCALQLYLYDIPTRRLSSPLTLNIGGPVRTVTWAPDMHHLALTSKHSVVLLRANFSALSSLSTGLAEKEVRESEPAFKVLSSLHENIRVKGGVWDPELGQLGHRAACAVVTCCLLRDSFGWVVGVSIFFASYPSSSL